MIIYYKSFYNFHENSLINCHSNTKYKKNIKKKAKISEKFIEKEEIKEIKN